MFCRARSHRRHHPAVRPLPGRTHRRTGEDIRADAGPQAGVCQGICRLGRSAALCRMAFSSPAASYVIADPGYEAGMIAAKAYGIRLVKVPLTPTYAHDVKAMLAAAPDAGLFYICNPNNPTGTLTSHSDKIGRAHV